MRFKFPKTSAQCQMLLATAGNTLTMIVTLPMVEFFGNDQAAWTITFIILGAVASISFFITFAVCHERIVTPPPEKNNLKDTLAFVRRLFKNKFWVLLTLAALASTTSDVVFGTANTYYCRYFLYNPNHIGTITTIMNGFKIGCLIIIIPLMLRKTTKRNALIVGFSLIIVAAAIRFIDPYSATVAFVSAAFWGLGQGFTGACVWSMIPDCVEYCEYVDHERHEGLVYSGASFSMKLANGLGAVIASAVIQMGGYVNNAPEQTDTAMNAIMIASTVCPALIVGLGIICIAGYGLDKIYPDVVKELQRRRIAAEAAGPAPAGTGSIQA